MGGLKKILKMYGEMKVSDALGSEVIWCWDYHKDEPRVKSEMTKDEINLSEKAKWEQIKKGS